MDAFLLMLVSMETVIRPSIYAFELDVAADVRCNVGKAACSGYAPLRSVPRQWKGNIGSLVIW